MTGRFTGTFARAIMMGLVALITTQLGQTAWAGPGSPLVLATAGPLAVLFAVVQTPGLSRSCGCRPSGGVLAAGCVAVGTRPRRSLLRWPTEWRPPSPPRAGQPPR